jgi:hypothetical protein
VSALRSIHCPDALMTKSLQHSNGSIGEIRLYPRLSIAAGKLGEYKVLKCNKLHT